MQKNTNRIINALIAVIILITLTPVIWDLIIQSGIDEPLCFLLAFIVCSVVDAVVIYCLLKLLKHKFWK